MTLSSFDPTLQIDINMSDSCKYCCGLFKPSELTPMYINHEGEAERFKRSKLTEEEKSVHRRSMARLEEMLKLMVKADEDKAKELMEEISQRSSFSWDRSADRALPITYGHIKQINQVLQELRSAR